MHARELSRPDLAETSLCVALPLCRRLAIPLHCPGSVAWRTEMALVEGLAHEILRLGVPGTRRPGVPIERRPLILSLAASVFVGSSELMHGRRVASPRADAEPGRGTVIAAVHAIASLI